MLDGDADYKINLSSSQQNLQYNFAYIIDVSGSMDGTPLQEAKDAYESLTNSLINSGIADVSQFKVIPFDDNVKSVSPSGLLDATQAVTAIQNAYGGGGTNFTPALNTAHQFFSGLPDGGTNIAYFLSDGRSSNGFETVANSLKSVADVQAYGIGGGVDTNQLKKVDSDGNISVLQNPSDLTAEFNNSDFSADSIAQINLLLDGTVVETIQSTQLIEDSLGLSFEGSINNLDISFGAENLLTAEIFFTDGTPTSTVDFTIASGLAEVTDDNPFDEIVNGTAGDDTIRLGAIDLGSNSGGGDDKVVGNDLDNILDSGSGNDIVFGNDGNDTITTGSGQDRIDGGDGIDTVVYINQLFADSSVQKVGNVITVDNTDTLTNVEFIQFSDVKISTENLQPVPILTTSDITIAEGNSSNTTAQFTFNLSLISAEDVQFTYSTQDLTAIAGEDYITKTGQVTIAAGETTATVEVEIIADTVSEAEELFVLNVSELSGATFDNDEQEYSVFATVEKDILEGSEGDDSLEGGDSDDTIFGKGGNDTLIGGAGADTLDGGNGNDTYFVDNAFDTIVENSSNGNDTVYSEVDFSIAEFGRVENLILTDNAIYGIGNSRDNVITGNSLDNILSDDEGEDTLNGGLGNDTLIGGTEDDTYIIDSLEDTIIENESEGFDIVEASIDYSIENIAHVEHLILTGNAIIGTGNSLDNYIDGNALDNVLNGLEGDDDILGLEGNDTLDGGTGDDTLRGGKGDDTYIIDSTSDTIIEESGNDTVKASINYSIASLNKIDNLTLTGDAISGTGNSDGNEIKGNALDNILDGVEGSDALYGGAGNDSLIGGTGRDTLNGGAGDDTLLGGEDKDTLSGGAGNNTLIGGTEDDTYIVDSLNNIIIENTSSGFDIVEASVDYSIDGFDNVEHLILTGSAVTGTGNSLDNYVDGNALDNVLNGQEGDDDIWGLLGNDILNGGTGDDTLTGHEGDDTLIGGMGDDELIGSAGADIFVFNNPNEGIDEITDFSVTDDTIHISAAGFGGGLTAGDIISEDQILIGSSSTANNATQRFIYNTNSGALYFDADGNQSGFDAVRIATLILEPTISASDIFVTL
jgi:Ca2+-binding RTX toxin-like protein